MPLDKQPTSTTATTPEECSRLLIQALETGNIEQVLALYEPDAILLRKSGKLLNGHDAIREDNLGLIAMKPVFTLTVLHATISADGTLATNRMQATLKLTDAEGKAKEASVDALEVLRRQADGTWKYVIDDPYGSMRANLEQR